MKVSRDYIPMFRGVDLSQRRLPFLIADSERDGPTICITAAIHGDEVTGAVVVSELFKRFEHIPLIRGRVFGFPILNPSGFETISRFNPYAAEDLNRSFPGRPDGKTAERLSFLILSALLDRKPNFVIDLHADSLNSILYSLVDYLGTKKTSDTFARSALLAEQLGIPWMVDTEENAGYPPEGCLTGSLVANGVPAVTLELGAPYIVMEDSVRGGIKAIWNYLTWLGMLPGGRINLPTRIPEYIYTIRSRVYTQSSGIISYRARPGQTLQKKQILGKIKNIFGETIEVIRSPVDGLLVSHEDISATFPGKQLFTIASQVPRSHFHLS
ncbi:hypothetical protein AUK40_03090 [Candidatus Wirthbacteria bacterium CG2_30_54_11]|uniref:Succinylglutamate desuccinylase/Aspartoacylase catalytic domain-containing protein n=1 Tax=Candidatus Wirthbacteria bacterium CG2_30_54_11 TaxID=1817892 RepID=A0A1J5IWC1_9BACT|nr:MAG: hypothetical protein AUK40_03090 [Candidatus Wirthbacteria bacterium CG2_30_54_11]